MFHEDGGILEDLGLSTLKFFEFRDGILFTTVLAHDMQHTSMFVRFFMRRKW